MALPLEKLERWVRKGRVPGCALASVRADGTTDVHVMGKSRLDRTEPVTAQTCFHLFSGTKLYTASALMKLVEAGAVSLDEPVQRHLPELPLRQPVSARQLASHSSGIPDTLRAFMSVHPGEEPNPSTSEALSAYDLSKGKAPGRVRYANVGYALLGELISRVAEREYEVFVREELLRPLGADLSFFYSDRDCQSPAVGHVPRLSPTRLFLPLLLPNAAKWINGYKLGRYVGLNDFSLDTSAIGGLVGAVPAYLPLLREMLSPEGGVLSAASKREMLTLQARGSAGITSREGVGIGWKLGRVGGVRFWNHEGGGPGFCSETRIYPESGLGIVILMNLSQSIRLSRICHKMCEQIRAAS